FCYTAKITIVFFCCFYIFKILHDFILFHAFIIKYEKQMSKSKIDFRGQGQPLIDIETIVTLIGSTTTEKGLSDQMFD
uniref:hypothetical protein n=1 Tax=Agathobacter sp. TaxID=2021311 RepID=UPI004055BA96